MKTSAYVKELQAQSVEQLQAQLVDAKKELFNLRFQNATNQLDNMDKTIVVAVRDNVRHPLYNKIVKKTYKLKAHDEKNDAKIGDTVRVMETRPLSKDKRWRLVEIMERAK